MQSNQMIINIILIMFANFFKKLIVSSFGTYIEDFTSDDIVIDKWNGQVVKDNVALKSTALESLGMSLFGAPVQVVRGYIKKLRIDIPWNKLLSKPCEVNIDEVHVVIKTSTKYDYEFAKRMIAKIKKGQVHELLEQVRKQKNTKEGGQDYAGAPEKETYMSRLTNIIEENLRLIVSNVHIRFEDQFSRRDHLFNWGITIDTLNYSVTNNNFERVFINIDDKKQEQKSFSMLEIKQIALYWNSNAAENWTKNPDFKNQPAQKIMDFSKKYIESLKRRYNQFLQNLSTNNVFLIQPCDIRMRFRKNLSPTTILEIPKSTSALDISGICLTIDEEVYKDVQYMMKLFSWHKKAVKENPHFKFRPPYNMPVKGNSQAYFKYAIQATLYLLRKQKKERHLKQKRHQEVQELSQLYVMKTVNETFERQNSVKRMLSASIMSGESEITFKFESTEQLEARIKHLEIKLTPEQILIAHLKAEKPSTEQIQKEAENSGWRSWIPGMLKGTFRQTQSPQQQLQSWEATTIEDFDQMLQNYQDMVPEETIGDDEETKSQLSGATESQRQPSCQYLKDRLLSHFSLTIPKIDISFVSKRLGAYSKYFMLLAITDLLYQTAKTSSDSQKLFNIKNLELIDKLTEKQKFSKAIMKNKQEFYQHQMVRSGNSGGISKKAMAKIIQQQAYEKQEIEQEASTNKNNGLPLVKDYDSILNEGDGRRAPFFLLQIINKSVQKKGEKCNQYNIQVFLNSLQIFYNRILISRAQTFINQATINRVQNAAAEADFDSKIQQLKHQTREKVSKILEKSEIQLLCNLKGLEILVPDSTNHEASKFLQIQTGNIVVKNGSQGGQYYSMKKPLQEYALQSNRDLADQFETPMTEDYSLTVYDFQVLYIPNFEQLENLQIIDNFGDGEKYTIIKKSDIQTDFKKNPEVNQSVVSISINSLDIQLTNREIKELKNFGDNLVRYHQQISLEVLHELQQIESINNSIMKFEQHFKSYQDPLIEDVDAIEESTYLKKLKSVFSQKSFHSRTRSISNEAQNHLSDNYKSAYSKGGDFFKDANSEGGGSYREKSLNEEEEEDEFFDAQDVFDKDIIQMLKLDELQRNHDKKEVDSNVLQTKTPQKWIIEFAIKNIKLNILEAADFHSDFGQALKARLGSFGPDQVDFDIKYKGVPFLCIQITKIGLFCMQNQIENFIAFGINKLQLTDVEKINMPLQVLQSTNCEIDDFFGELSSPLKKVGKDVMTRGYRDLEEEDQILITENNMEDETLDDYFARIIFRESKKPENSSKNLDVRFGMLQIELKDQLISKIMDTLIVDFPISQKLPLIAKTESQQDQPSISTKLYFVWQGSNLNLYTKKDTTSFKLGKLDINYISTSEEKQIKVALDDFRLSQNDSEIVLKLNQEAFENIITITNFSDMEQKQTEIIIEKLLIIGDVSNINSIIATFGRVQNIINLRKNYLKPSQPAKEVQIGDIQIQSSVSIILNNTYVQVPLKDNKNSLYLMLQNFEITKKQAFFEGAFDQCLIFVARSVDQEQKYNLLSIEDFKIMKIQGLFNIDIEKVTVALNENYVLLLANIVDQHFEESLLLLTKIKSNKEQMIEAVEELQEPDLFVISEDRVQGYLSNIALCYQFERIKDAISQWSSIFGLRLGQISLQWVFDQSFDDHQDNYVTLFNKNFSQQILSQFDQKTPEVEMIDTSSIQRRNNTSSTLLQDQKMNKTNTYQKLVLEVNCIIMNRFTYLELEETYKTSIAQCQLFTLYSIDQQNSISNIFNVKYENHLDLKDEMAIGFISESNNYFELLACMFEVAINNKNMRVISQITKAIYSCKNILKRGKKREIFQRMFKSSEIQQESQKEEIQFDFRLDRFRFVVSNISDREIKNVIMQSIGAADDQDNKTQLVFEGGIQAERNVKYDEQIEASQQIRTFTTNIKQTTLYLEPKLTSSILEDENIFSQKVILIYPFNSTIDLEKFTNEAQQKVFSIAVAFQILEIEFSLKQVFSILQIIDKIKEEATPIISIIKHIKAAQQKSSKKQKDEVVSSPAIPSKLVVFLDGSQLYLTIVKELESSQTEVSCMPLFSLELKKKIEARFSITRPDQIMKISCGITLELFYFNSKLNFYEPLIEKTNIVLNYTNQNKVLMIQNQSIVNINFSVALYDTLFLFMNTLNLEKDDYERTKELTLLDEHHHLHHHQHKRHGKRDIDFNPSSFNIKNNTGEMLLFKTSKQPAFAELQPEEVQELEFDNKKEFNEDVAAKVKHESGEDEIIDEGQMGKVGDQIDKAIKPVSKYRMENLRYLRGQPKKVYLQLHTQNGKNIDRSSVFEVNLDSLTCQRVYLDDQRTLYVICQTQTKNGIKHLIVRSPMQITNNLQIPMEIRLIQNATSSIQRRENISNQEEFSNSSFLIIPVESRMSSNFSQHEIVIKPEQSVMIPLRACGFNQVQMRPLLGGGSKDQLHKDSNFDWTNIANVSLLKDDRDIFDTKPIVMTSKIVQVKDQAQRYNNQLFFMLNANVYSIRSFIDFNTQQTDFISLKYLSISPPFNIQNLLPVTLLLQIKNIQRSIEPNARLDPKTYKLEMKMNSSIQTLSLNPLGNFDLSLCIPGFDSSPYVSLKKEGDDDLYEQVNQEEQSNYIASMRDHEVGGDPTERFEPPNQPNPDQGSKNQFRFLRQKKLLFQMTSKYQNQFNVCVNFAFIQGYYHISFYAKYWFLNNTQMPLQLQMTTDTYSFDKYDLPYERLDFDFESIKKFLKNEAASTNASKGKGENERKNSVDSFQTETVKDTKSQYKSGTSQHKEDIDEGINYKDIFARLKDTKQYQSHIRLRPWESYKIYKESNEGLIAALSQEDIDQVSTIYMAQEQLKEEEKEEEEYKESNRSKKGVKFNMEAAAQDYMKLERNTMFSKNTMQMNDYQHIREKEYVLPLNQVSIAQYNLFDTPLADKDQVKRVVLFSDNPLEDKQLATDSKLILKIWQAYLQINSLVIQRIQ